MSQTLSIALHSGALFVAVGLFGSLVEMIGKIAGAPRVESAGRFLEAAAVDVPKALSGLRNVAQGKAL